MSIQIIDNFDLSLAKPIDNRFVVGALSFYTNKDSIPLKYNGLRIYDTTDSTPYIWTGATWSYDIDRISVNLDNTTNSSHYIPFVGATFGVNYIKTSDKGLKYNPLYSQVLLADGSVNTPTLSFSSSTNLGIYRVNSTTLGFASSGAKRFEISSTSATSSVPFSVNISTSGPAFSVSSTGTKRFEVTNTSATSSVRFNVLASSVVGSPAFKVSSVPTGGDYSKSAMSIGYSQTTHNFEFYPYSTSSEFSIAVPTGSDSFIQANKLRFINYEFISSFGVRDQHYITTPTVLGRIDIGNYNNYNQFIFAMQGRTDVLGGGGLRISNNLLVDGTASIINNVSIGHSSNTTIFSGSSLFSSSVPKLEVLSGLSTETYKELMSLRHSPVSGNAVLRRLGYIMKLSGEGDGNESSKMGGVILESLNEWANFPSLYLVTGDKKRLGIDYFGNIYATNSSASAALSTIFGNKMVISSNDIYADIHNKGTQGIGDSGNAPITGLSGGESGPWNYPSISSGQFAISNVLIDPSNVTHSGVKPLLWMRVGNTVNVSGQIMVKILAANVATTFRLPIPLKSYFNVSNGNSNNWQLNGIGKVVDKYGSLTSYSGDVVTIQASGSPGYALFKFKPSSSGGITIVFSYQYIMGSWPAGAILDDPDFYL